MTVFFRLCRAVARSTLDAILPPRCLKCRAIVAAPGALCSACWAAMDFLEPPACARCGYPFEFDPGPGAVCGTCAGAPPAYGRARAVLRYDEASRGLVIDLKHADRTDGVPAFGQWLARAGADLLSETDLLVPVPLHRWRLFARRYNQAAMLAAALSRLTGRPMLAEALVRRRNTPSQGRLGRSARRRNVAGAFRVPAKSRPRIAGKQLLLVDDVLTTGATAEACAEALLGAGAGGVDVLTLARVVRPQAGG